MKTRIAVSACLLGERCRYDAWDNKKDSVINLYKYFELVPVCPECLGGLSIPREPSEIRDGRVYTQSGEDVTDNFLKGADHVVYIAKEKDCPAAVLKTRSPSCGFGEIYDGTFSGTLCKGNGITAQMLNDEGIQVFGENDLKKLIELYYYEDEEY